MKLSTEALEKMNNRSGKASLMKALGFSEIWVTKCLAANKANGPLTTASAIAAIKEETGLKQSEILEEVSQEQKIA